VHISVGEEGKDTSPVHEEKTFTTDNSYENICRRVIGKCSFLLLAVQPSILGESALLTYANVRYDMQICCRTWLSTLQTYANVSYDVQIRCR